MGTQSSEQHYSLRWNDYTVKIVTAFQSLRDEEDFVDVTVACDGHQYPAHKMVLSACSPYFRSLLKANPCKHPIVILKDVGHIEMERLLEFMYNGEVNIAQDQLAAFLKTAECLKIRGLAGSSEDLDQSQRDPSHNYSSFTSIAGNISGISGRNSPCVSFNSTQELKDEDISTDGVFHTNNSPATKRRKRTSGAPAATDSSTSHSTDNMTGDGLLDGGADRPGSIGGDTSIELDDDSRVDRRELKSEPSDHLHDVYGDTSDLGSEQNLYNDGLAGPSGSMNNQDGLHPHDHADVSALMAIANAEQAASPSDRPTKCPLCMNIIRQARNLRRHVFKRHLPAAQRGEITEEDVKNILERKHKSITVTPLTEEELRQVQLKTRKRGTKTPRKPKGVLSLPSDVNGSNINESEITIRKLPRKRGRKSKNAPPLASNVFCNTDSMNADMTSHEDILQEALAERDKDDPQEEVMDLATPQQQQQQQQLPPISVVTSHTAHTGIQTSSQPVPLSGGQSSSALLHSRLQSESSLQTDVRHTSDSPLYLHRDLIPMPPMAFEPQVSISESMTTYHTTSPSQGMPQSTSPSPVAGYIPATYWSTPGMAGLPTTTFQPHPSVFTPAHAEYFTAGMHMARPSSLDRMPQHRRKPYQ